MLNICFPRTKPLRASRGKNQCFPSENPLSIPSPEPQQRQPGPSLPLQPGTGLFSGAEHSRRLWRGHLPALSPRSAPSSAGCRAEPAPGVRQGREPRALTPQECAGGRQRSQLINPSFVQRHSSNSNLP